MPWDTGWGRGVHRKIQLERSPRPYAPGYTSEPAPLLDGHRYPLP